MLDFPAVTAARLSATFPFVTPTARPTQSDLGFYHVADGGYFDNFGALAAIQWIHRTAPIVTRHDWCLREKIPLENCKENFEQAYPTKEDWCKINEILSPDCDDAFAQAAPARKAWCSRNDYSPIVCDRIIHVREPSFSVPRMKVLFIQIKPFPPEPFERKDSPAKHWLDSLLDPVETLLNVRTSTQAARTDVELAILRQIDAVELDAVSFSPPVDSNLEPPLSWQLSEENKRQIALDWCHSANQDVIIRLRRNYFPNSVKKIPGYCHTSIVPIKPVP